jgi:hypothetical protein
MDRGRIKVLYIAGAGRSGSTLLARALGQQPGWFDGGEIFRFPENVTKERVCGCGMPFVGCPVWTEVLQQAFGGLSQTAAQALSWRNQPVKNRHYLLGAPSRVDRRVRHSMAGYLASIAALYRTIGSVAGASVIIDSSKSPLHGHLLELTGAVDLRVLHLVRDPRAVAYSTARRQKAGQRSQGLFETLHSWVRWNLLASKLWEGGSTPYMLVRYEDFVARPRQVLADACALAGEESTWQGCFRGERELWLEPTHHISGNVGKHATGSVTLRPDEEWRERMAASDRAIATAWCSPWFGRYGYVMRGDAKVA